MIEWSVWRRESRAWMRWGLPKGRTTLLTGTTGSGKTVFALQFLAAGVNSFGQPGVLVTLEEPAEELIANMSSFGWDLAGLVSSGQIAVIDATDRGEEVVSGGFDFRGPVLPPGDPDA